MKKKREIRIEECKKWIDNQIDKMSKNALTGNLQINFFKGGITNINKNENNKKVKISRFF